MNILALDTTMLACSAAVLRGADGELFHAYEERERGHAEAIMPMIDRLMAEAKLDYGSLGKIGVTTGPGTFTGVRVGIAAARGLALATGAGTVGVTSLAVIARMVLDRRADESGLVAVACDARRGQVYFALFDASGRALSDHMAVTPEDAAGLLPTSGPFTLAGSGAALVADAALQQNHQTGAVLADIQPDAATLVRMVAGRDPEPKPVSPVYLRAPDAKPQDDKTVSRL